MNISTFQMATTAGLPSDSVYKFEYCFNTTTVKLLKNLEIKEMGKLLTKWGINYIDNNEVIKKQFFDAVATLFALSNFPTATLEIMEATEVDHITEIKIPQWVKEFRSEGIPESDIREIVIKVGNAPKHMKLTPESSIKRLAIGSPAKRVLQQAIKDWKSEPTTTKKTVKPDVNVDDLIDSDYDYEDTLSQILSETNRETDRNQLRDRGHRRSSIRRSSVRDSPRSTDDEEESEVHRRSLLRKCKPKLPVLPPFTQGMEAWGWLQAVKRNLMIERCHDDDKLYVLQKAMAYEFLPIAKQLDQEKHTSKSYIAGLEKALRNPACLAQATAEFHALKWNYDVHPNEFFKKLEDMVVKIKGEPSKAEFIQDVLLRIPTELRDNLIRSRSTKSFETLKAAMVDDYYIELRKRSEKKSDKNTPEKYKESYKKEGNRDNRDSKDDKRGERSEERKNFNSFRGASSRPPFRCYNCNRMGHTSRDCRMPRRGYSDRNQTDKPNTFQPAQLRMQNQPTYGKGNGNGNPSTPKESANLVNEANIQGKKLPKAPVHEFMFMTSEYEEEEPVELITRIDATVRNFPTVRLNLCYPDRKMIKTGDVLIDTGASTACIDYELAQQLNAYVLSSNVAVRGIIGGSFQPVEGAAYAIMKHSKMQTAKVVKFQVMRNLEPMMVFGTRFTDVFFVGMVNYGGYYQVNLKEKVDGEWLSPELMFRFCTPEESYELIDQPEVPINTIKEAQKLVNTLNELPNSPWFEKEITPHVDPKQEVIRQNFIHELSMVKEFDNVYPVYLHIEQKELSLAERLLKRMDENLKTEKRMELLSILMLFPEVFSQSKADLGLVPWERWPIKIDIEGNEVPYQKPYPCTIEKRLEYQKIIADLLENDIIEDASDAKGGSPAMLIGKPDGSFRLLNDLRAVNRLTKVVYHPMPRIDDCLEAIRGAKFFNMFDLYQGYFQIEIPPSERGKTVFVTPDGKYQYKRLPMGLACAPFEFQRLMNTVLNGLNYTECLGYFDDIPVIGKSWTDLLENTKLVLERLRDWNLKVKTDKCKFGVTELILLGHLVNGEGIRPDPDKVAALKRLPYPNSVRQLQSQLGCYNYFARYIHNFSKLAAPLYRLVSKERKFKMLRQDHEALDKLKNSLIETTMLAHFDPNMRKKLTVDASDIACGGILLQEDENQPIPEGFQSLREVPLEKIKCWKPLYFFSQRIAKHQESYSVSEKECLSVLIAIRKFRHYLDGEEFLVETDHHALCQLPKLKFKNQRLERWTIILSSYKFKVIYAKGETHGPDCLSRYQNEWDHRKQIDPEKEYIENLFLVEYKVNFDKTELAESNESEIRDVKEIDSTLEKSLLVHVYHYQTDENWKINLVQFQQEDEVIKAIINELISDAKSKKHEKFLFINNLLFIKPTIGHDLNRIVINDKVLEKLFIEEHCSPIGGHFGIEKTYLQLSRRFWMPSMYEKVKELCQNCEKCYIGKSSNCTFSEPSLKPIPETVLDRLEMDAQGPLTFKNGAKKVILVLIDTLTRFVYAKLYTNQTSSTVISFLNEFFSLYGFPSIIQTDRGRNFLSGDVSKHLKNVGIKHEISNAYHPQSQGIVERVNRTIAERLRTSIIDAEKVDLKTYLEDALIAINGSIHKIHRFSPYFLVYGKQMKKPIDLQLELESPQDKPVEECRKLARERLIKQQVYYQNRLQSVTRRNPYSIGSLCYVKNSAPSLGTTKKLVQKFFGPYFVLGVKKGSALLLNPETRERFTSNLELTRPHVGVIPESLTQLRDEIVQSAENETQQTFAEDGNDNESDLNETLKHFNAYDQSFNEEIDNSLDVNVSSSSNDLNEDDNASDNEKSTIADEEFYADLNQFNRKKKRRKYKTANREIMMDNAILNNSNEDLEGPVTRRRRNEFVCLILISTIKADKSISMLENQLKFENQIENQLNKLIEEETIEKIRVNKLTKVNESETLKRFKDSANKPNNCSRAFGNQQLTERTKVLTESLSLPLSLSQVDLFVKVKFFDFNHFLKNFNSFCAEFIQQLTCFTSASSNYSLCLIKFDSKSKKSFSSKVFDLCNCLTNSFSFSELQRGKFVPIELNIELDLIYFWKLFVKQFCEIVFVSRIAILRKMSSPSPSRQLESEDSNDSIAFAIQLGKQLAKIPIRAPVVDLTTEQSNAEENSTSEVKTEKVDDQWGNWGLTPQSTGESSKDADLQWPGDDDVVDTDIYDIDLVNTDARYAKFKIYDPLPKRTALGLSTFNHKEKDTSPYPPPEPNQRRFNTLFPAPRPPTEEEQHDFTRLEFFTSVHDDVKANMEKAEKDRAWFETFIREKIQFNVAETNLDKVSFSKLVKGLSAGQVIHPELARFKSLITCNLCEQIAILPKVCAKCTKPYCIICIRWLQGLPSDLGLETIKGLDEFLCVNQVCLISVERYGYPKYKFMENPELRKFYEEATFKCIHMFCEHKLKVNQLANHYQSCKRGPINYKFDKTLQRQFMSGPVREELNKQPISIASLMPAHIKKQDAPISIPEMWKQRAMVYSFLVQKRQKDPSCITPLQMRAAANFCNNYWNNYKRIKDPTEPIDEAEEFVLKLGFPSCSETPIPEVERRWPMTQCSKVPEYLLRESANWRRWNKYMDPIPDDLSETSSVMLYALDIEDPESPFVRIDPFERLSPEEAEKAREFAAKHLPSCFNPRSIYKAPSPRSTSQWNLHYVNVRRQKLAESFKNRPKANIPKMLDEQMKVIEEFASTCPDRHLIFSINMFYIRIKENAKLRPRPCWIAIIDGNSEVVYETFVKYKEIDYVDESFHGLTAKDLQHARPLATARDQVLKYLACGNKIIGCGLINQFSSLGLSEFDIVHLRPKFREITNFYSPYFESPMTLHAVAFLWFCGYTLPAIAHSPVVEAITALRLYYLQWSAIERKAFEFNGIHNENQSQTCGNRITATLLKEFDEGIAKGLCSWPEEWKTNPRISKYPRYDEHCVHPSKLVIQVPNEMTKPDVHKTYDNYTPQSRNKRIIQAIQAAKRSNLTTIIERVEPEPKSAKPSPVLSPASSKSGSYHTPPTRSRSSSCSSNHSSHSQRSHHSNHSRHSRHSQPSSRNNSKPNSREGSRNSSRRSSVSREQGDSERKSLIV
uniref:RNA-directed DNA polymerase n=1 Tax=Tetranychus urticae TaxID=32264 RepID=T1KEK1_TETUR